MMQPISVLFHFAYVFYVIMHKFATFRYIKTHKSFEYRDMVYNYIVNPLMISREANLPFRDEVKHFLNLE